VKRLTSKMPAVLGYWDIRGLAQPIRLLLNYVGEDFEDKRYSCGPAPDFNKDCWFKADKFELGLDFPNLPYYIDGDIKLTQTHAIMRYIANKFNIAGSTTEERVRIDLMLEESMDVRNQMVRLSYNPNFTELRDSTVANVRGKLENFEKFLGERPFFAGDQVTLADFHMYEMLDQYTILEPTMLKDTPKLKAFKDRFEALPPIKKYMESDNFLKAPLNNKMASFGNK
jgi:glutathione S-transferase